MEKPEVIYKRKPSFISFSLVYFAYGFIALLLIVNSQAISLGISTGLLSQLDIPRTSLVWNVPFGILLAIPFIVIGIRRLLWNIMSIYEIDSKEIRLIVGSLSRKEYHFALSDVYDVSFKQNLVEAPFRVGSLILTNLKSGRQMILKGVHNVKQVVEVLRTKAPNSR